jgi:hypothetical protein
VLILEDDANGVAIGCDLYNQTITGSVAASVTAATGISNASGPKVIVIEAESYRLCGEESAETSHKPLTDIITLDAVQGGGENER